MSVIRFLAFASVSTLAMSTSCSTKDDITPRESFVTGTVVKTEITVDAQSNNPRTRWIIAIAPLSLPGWQGKTYQQAKVFALPDTSSYKAGTTLTFHYRLIPEAQQTPWNTPYEWYSVPALTQPPGAVPLPEITISDVTITK